MRACTHKRNISGIGVIILEENLVQIGLAIAEILLLMKCYLDMHFKGQLIRIFCRQLLLHYFGEILVKLGHIIGEK